MSAVAARGRLPFEPERCPDCGDPLVGPPGSACTRGACAVARVRRNEGERRRRRLDRAQERLRARGIDPDRVSWSPTPAFEGGQVPVPDEARARFRAHLEALLAEATDDTPLPQGDEPPEPVQHGVFGAACTACGGRCCRMGATRGAFLTSDTLRRVMRDRLDVESSADLLAVYLDHVGPTHAKRSCVFHGETGCRLPRTLRSDTCNRWFCGDLGRLLNGAGRFDDVPDGHAFVAVGHDGRRDGGIEFYSSRANAASNADADGGKSTPRT